MGRWGNAPVNKMQNVYAQRHSIMSNLKVETENSLPQRYSKMSNGRLPGLSCWSHRQNGMLTMQIKNIARCFMRHMRAIGVMGGNPEKQNRPVQRGSGNSKLGVGSLGILRRKTENKAVHIVHIVHIVHWISPPPPLNGTPECLNWERVRQSSQSPCALCENKRHSLF